MESGPKKDPQYSGDNKLKVWACKWLHSSVANPTTWLRSKSRPRPRAQCADSLFQKRIDFKHQDIDCFGVGSVRGIAAAALGLGPAQGTPLVAGLVPLCPVITNDVVEPCDLN